MPPKLLPLIAALFFSFAAIAQKKAPLPQQTPLGACSEPGTIPSLAIPVCGTKVFFQDKVTVCTGPNMTPNLQCPDPFPSGSSFWYKFKCFQSGTLGFLLKPRSGTDDYDFILFDITGHNPDDVFTDHTLPISVNGSGTVGNTGCTSAGTSNANCYNSPNPINKLADLVDGHNYLLMVTNFTNSTQGYDLSFEGGSAVISDGTQPTIDHIDGGCSSVKVTFTTDIKCSSVSNTGSEFSITPGTNTITGISSNCNTPGFIAITDLTINLANNLTPGSYTLTVNKGSDGNTFLNVCDDEMKDNVSFSFIVYQPKASFTYPAEICRKSTASFSSTSDPINGNTITEWHWLFGDGGTAATANPTYVYSIPGTYTVKHWIVNSVGCNSDTVSHDIVVNDLPAADFTYTQPTCQFGTVLFTDASIPNSGNLNSWQWDFGDPLSTDNTSALTNPVHTYTKAGTYTVTLGVTSDKGCNSPVATKTITVFAKPKAGFINPEVCLSDTYAQFTDTSKVDVPNTITAWDWDFGDGSPHSTVKNPQHSYTAVGTYNVTLIVTSNAGCRDTIIQPVTVNGSFPVAAYTIENASALCSNDSVAITNMSSVFPGSITKLEIWWDDVNAGPPSIPQKDDLPFPGKVYKHLYPNFQSPLTKTYNIRVRAYSGGVCTNDKVQTITLNASPKVQFDAMPAVCNLAAPFQVTQAFETGGVPGMGVYSGAGISPSGIFSPALAGIGTHNIKYTYTASAAGCTDSMTRTITVLDTAHADFSFTLPACEAAPVTFSDHSTAPSSVIINNTVWDFGDGTALENHAPGAVFTHVFAAAGMYTITMHTTSADGCTSTNQVQTITILPVHHISLITGNDVQTVCINTQVVPIQYQLSGGATGVTVTGLPAGMQWNISGDIVTVSGAPSTTVNSPYTFHIQTTGNSCAVASASGIITVLPDHTIQENPGTLSHQSVCLYTGILPINYTIGGGATGATATGLPHGVQLTLTGNLVTISGTPDDLTGGPDFNYTITTTGNACVKAVAAGTIKVNAIPVPSFSFDEPVYCIPNAIVTFINESTIADHSFLTYQWNFGDPINTPNSSSAIKPNHQYTSTGPFNVTLTATSDAVLTPSGIGCSHDTVIVLKTVHPQPKADFSLDHSTVCLGNSIALVDMSDYKDGVSSQLRWSMGDGSILTRSPVTYTYRDSTTYTIDFYAVNNLGCNSDTIQKQVTVYPYPHVNAGPDRLLLEGGSIQLETSSYASDPVYTWSPGTFLNNTHIANPVISNATSDMFYLFSVTGRGGCTTNDDVFVKLLRHPKIPNTFTPNGDGINDTWKIQYLDLYPSYRVQVFTRTGQLVYQSTGNNNPWNGTFNGRPLPFDTYYYIIEPGSGRKPITGYVTIVK
ncbi:MAG: PKD domain-containing protein [Bacteroidetes bacterium]|nr:PKD domain-containing protein [Bacteroidota bacterium]